MDTCRNCGSDQTKPYETKPPEKHNGPCTDACLVRGYLCLNCRMFYPKKG